MIRSFQRGDLARLYELDQLCFPAEIAYSRAELRYYLTQPNCYCWVVEDPQTQLSGFIIVERVTWRGMSAGHIVTLDVDIHNRRRGLGRQLMETAEAKMRREGASVMSLEVAENNADAQRFYRNLGFLASGKIAKYYGGRIDAEVMQKLIRVD